MYLSTVSGSGSHRATRPSCAFKTFSIEDQQCTVPEGPVLGPSIARATAFDTAKATSYVLNRKYLQPSIDRGPSMAQALHSIDRIGTSKLRGTSNSNASTHLEQQWPRQSPGHHSRSETSKLRNQHSRDLHCAFQTLGLNSGLNQD